MFGVDCGSQSSAHMGGALGEEQASTVQVKLGVRERRPHESCSVSRTLDAGSASPFPSDPGEQPLHTGGQQGDGAQRRVRASAERVTPCRHVDGGVRPGPYLRQEDRAAWLRHSMYSGVQDPMILEPV